MGAAIGEDEQVVIKGNKGSSKKFRMNVTKQIDELVKWFSTAGVDCTEFLPNSSQGAESKPCSLQSAQVGDTSSVPNARREEIEGQNAESGEASTDPKKANGSRFKSFGRYLLKLGKKVLPIGK